MAATKWKAAVKERLTVRDEELLGKGSEKDGKKKKGRGPLQVICNSGTSSALILFSVFVADQRVKRVLALGSLASYAAATADTLSSEIGILSGSPPRYILAPWRVCLPGENGAVSVLGLIAGAVGSAAIAVLATEGRELIFALGVAGTLLDSVLGAAFQGSVVHGGKVVENERGGEVMVIGEQRGGGLGWTNNMVNMATTSTIGVMGVWCGMRWL